MRPACLRSASASKLLATIVLTLAVSTFATAQPLSIEKSFSGLAHHPSRCAYRLLDAPAILAPAGDDFIVELKASSQEIDGKGLTWFREQCPIESKGLSDWLQVIDIAPLDNNGIVKVALRASPNTIGKPRQSALRLGARAETSPIAAIPVEQGAAATGPAIINTNGIVNNASFQASLSPGALFSIFGTNLANVTRDGFAFPLPLTFAGLTVTINGVACPLLFVSPGQINAQVPMGLPYRAVPLVVNNNGSVFTATIQINTASPGLYMSDFRTRAVVQTPDGVVRGPSNPPAIGDEIVLYGTGPGEVSPSIATGQAAGGGSALRSAINKVNVLFAGVAGEVTFAGLTPGYAGLMQINVRIPAGITPGDNVPVAVNIAGNMSQTAYLSVRAGSVATGPTINSFAASANSIQAGSATSLSWNVSNSSDVSIDSGIGAVGSSGSRQVSPSVTTTYTLTARASGVTRTAAVTIQVSTPNESNCTIAPRGGSPSETYFLDASYTLPARGSWWVQSFSLGSQRSLIFRFVSDYQAQAAIIRPDQLDAFKNNQAFIGFGNFDNQFGTHTVTLPPGQYYVAVRNTVTTANPMRYEVDYPLQVPGATFNDFYLNRAENVAANGGYWVQPFTIACGVRHFIDGANSGMTTYVIQAKDIGAFTAGQPFSYYTDYSSPSVDTQFPGFDEYRLPPGDYALVFRNTSANAKSVVYVMERWR